jgi:hypothetical protein
MSVPVRIFNRPVRPPALEQLQMQLGLPYGDDFTCARRLLTLVEASAPLLSERDRIDLSRLLYAAAHAVSLLDKRG